MKHARFSFISCFCLFLLTGVGAAAPRKFISTDGREIVATLVAVHGEQVQLQRADGKAFKIPINRFSAEDVDYIKRWAEENKGKVPAHLKDKKPRMAIQVSTGRRSKKDDQISGYIDERQQALAFKVILENEDQLYPIEDAAITLWITAESPETREKAVVYKEVYKGVALPLHETRTVNAKPFTLWYDDEGAMYGHNYKGYFVTVRDPEGKLLGEVTNPSSAVKYLDAIEKLNTGDVYKNDYSKKGTVSLSRSVKFDE